MKQFILKEGPDKNGFIRLGGRDYHYLVRVRRLKSGDSFRALLPAPDTGAGQEARAVTILVRSAGDGVLVCECSAEEAPGAVSEQPHIILFQALPKGTKMDLIVRQAAEGGLRELVPFAAEHSVKTGGTVERWQRIVKEACQQSGSRTITEIRPLSSFDDLLVYWEKLRASLALGIFFHQEALEKGTFHDYLSSNPKRVVLAVGPEGGFSPGEVRRFLDAGFKPLCMGNTVLRTETAALYGAAAVRIILLERASWVPTIQS